MNDNDIAIIGMACRFPGAATIDQFWQNLLAGTESITQFTDDELIASGVHPSWLSDRNYVRVGGVLDDIDRFDATLFGYSPREAISMDPQQRLMLEITWECLEHAGYPPLDCREKIGVFAGSRYSEYLQNILDPVDISGLNENSIVSNWLTAINNDKDILVTRLAHDLHLRGPAIAVQTACSTSLVAVHLACQSLRHDECEMALVGGVCMRAPQKVGYQYNEGMIFSPDGHTRSFDANAQGTIFSSGAGMVLLKPLERALRDGDHVEAVIKASAINNDGGAAGLGITAPSVIGQTAVVLEALREADVDIESITCIEAHGTATAIGDPVEVQALTQAFREYTQAKKFCALGSVKSNIGHMVQASGIAGLIKTVLMLKHRQLVPSLNFNQPNPRLDLDNSPFYIPVVSSSWNPEILPRRAGISSFGVGGTNAHVIMEEAPECTSPEKMPLGASAFPDSMSTTDRPLHILSLSALSTVALEELMQRFGDFLKTNTNCDIGDLCYTANTGRRCFPYRMTFIASTGGELIEQINFGYSDLPGDLGVTPTISNDADPIITSDRCDPTGHSSSDPASGLVFLFTGQGSQYVNMGRQLYETQPTYRQVFDQCDAFVGKAIKQSLKSVVYPRGNEATPIDDLEYAPIAIFAIEYALAQMWMSWGIKPTVVLGHSLGEYTAACIAGIMTLEDTLTLLLERSRLILDRAHSGGMLAVFAERTYVENKLSMFSDQLTLAVHNSPSNMVVVGDCQSLDRLLVILEKDGVKSHRLKVAHGFHSYLMDPVLPAFAAGAKQLSYSPSVIKMFSTVTNSWIDAEHPIDADYWCRQLREPVLFTQAMSSMWEAGYKVFLEIGPNAVLTTLGQEIVPDDAVHWCASLKRKNPNDWEIILESLSRLYRLGIKVDWVGFDRDYLRQRIALPTYPFQRQRYWFDKTPRLEDEVPNNQDLNNDLRMGNDNHPLLGRRLLSPLTIVQYQSCIDCQRITWLKDHVIFDRIVFPGAGYVEMAIAAAREQNARNPFTLRDMIFRQPLFFLEEQSTIVHTVLTPAEGDDHNTDAISISSYHTSTENAMEWINHSEGRVIHHERAAEMSKFSLADLHQRCQIPVSIPDYFDTNRNKGMDFGTSFQAIEHLWMGDNEALGLVKLPTPIANSADSYFIHPVLLDACLKVSSVIFKDLLLDQVYLPFSMESLTGHQPLGGEFWCHATMSSTRTNTDMTLHVDINILDATGQVKLIITNFCYKRVNPQSFSITGVKMNHDHWLYQVQWIKQSQSISATSRSWKSDDWWLLLAVDEKSKDQIHQFMRKHQQNLIVVRPHTGSFNKIDSQQYLLNPHDETGWSLLLDDFQDRMTGFAGIIDLWAMTSGEGSIVDTPKLTEEQEYGCLALLSLLQALLKCSLRREWECWIVTDGCQPVGDPLVLGDITAAPLWGLGNVIHREIPEIICRMIDLDPTITGIKGIEVLNLEMDRISAENHIAYRDKTRYVARLTPYSTPAHPSERINPLEIPADNVYQIDFTERGLLDNLICKPMSREVPGPGEVEISVFANGINFRDVFNLLGKYPGDPGPLGFECSGMISGLGPGVNSFAIGDRVVARAKGCFCSHLKVASANVALIPDRLSYAEAAALPVVFLTAWYGLVHFAGIKTGDRVLIHAAAGGVGLAAIQIAHHAGAEIYATASPAKW